jgi:hypothetical protein
MPDMPNDRYSTSEDAILAVGGILFVGAVASGRSRVQMGPAAGWTVPRGIADWERELSFVTRASMTPGLASALRATLAGDQIAPKRFPQTKKAVEASPLLALAGNLVDDVRAQGVRVHTVGVDRVSGGFYYFEEGGKGEPVRVQGNLVDMLAPSIGSSSTNAEIAAHMEGLIDRLLLSLSGGVVSELAVELADALPRLSRDGTGLLGTDLAAFEAQAAAFASRASRWEAGARRIPRALEEAARKGLRSTPVPLFGEAQQEARPDLEVLIAGETRTLAGPIVWTVTGTPREEPKPAAAPAPAAGGATPARPSPSPVPARPSPSPTPARRSPSPVPAKPSPVSTPSRVVVIGPESPQPVKPAPLRFTPIPPRPEPTAPPASPAQASAPTPTSEAASASPPTLAAASASAPAPAAAPSAAPSASSTAITGRPGPRPPEKPSSSATLILALVALAALAYVAFERLLH